MAANDLTNVIPQLLAQGLLALRENCVMPRLVNSDYGTVGAQKGATISIPIPSAVAAQEVTPANVPPATEGVKPTEANISLDQWIEAPFYLTDNDLMQCAAGTIPMQASEAIKSIGNYVDKFLLARYKKIYGNFGTAGTTPFATDTTDATGLRKVLNKQLAPLSDRRAVLDPDAEGNALNLRAFQDTSWAGDSEAIKNGILTPKIGFIWHMDQNVPTHIAGTLADGVVSGNHVAGDNTVLLGSVAGGTLKEGDLISFAGHDQSYVVRGDITIVAGATNTATVAPPLQVNVAGAVAVTVVEDHAVNLGFHRDCFAFVSRPLLDNVQGLGNLIQAAADPVSGLALRLEISREHKRTRYSYDILFGGDCVRADLGARLLG